jgi:hypothetical protein
MEQIPMERTYAAFRRSGAVILTTLIVTSAAAGQEAPQPPRADPADVGSMDAIVEALYAVISGPVGEARDWDRFRSLFIPEARLIPTGRGAAGNASYRVLAPDDYIQANGQGLTSVGFMETEVARTVETFGNVSHVFSTYESKFTRNGEPATARGINSIQLFDDGSRWWIVSVFWDSERPDNPIPAKYLPGGSR